MLDNRWAMDTEPTPEVPPLDARIDGDEFMVWIDVPGLAEPPTVSLGRDRLVVEGRAQRRPFRREIALPPGLDRDKLELDYVAGVLRINIPSISN